MLYKVKIWVGLLLLWPFSKTIRNCWRVNRFLRQSKGDYGQFLSLVGHYIASTGDHSIKELLGPSPLDLE